MYGSAGSMLSQVGSKPVASKPKSSVVPTSKVLTGLISCVIAPWVVFICVYGARAMWMRYQYPGLSLGLVGWFFVVVLCTGVMAIGSLLGKAKTGDPKIFALLFVSCLVAWIAAFHFGDTIYHQYTKLYYEITSLNTYPSVNPQDSVGQQFMDAGILNFQQGSKLDISRSMGFKDKDVYCVAPITKGSADSDGDQTDSSHGDQKDIDFWAVGINCCSGHMADFACGEYNLPTTRTGVRLMRDDQKQFFRLAVKKAEAEYNIRARQPVFLHWVADASDEIQSFHDDYIKYYITGVFSFLCFQLFVVVFAGILFSKM